MKTVWTLEVCFPYEGCTLRGVFSSQQAAEAWFRAHEEDYPEYSEWVIDNPDAVIEGNSIP
jgi:hypothetical protein